MYVFVSDVHLNEPQSKRYGAFLLLLDQVLKHDNLEELFLVGDIFDLWLGDRKVFRKLHGPVIERIEKIAKIKPVHYFEGNHDFQLGSFWSDMGVKIYPGEHVFELKGQKVLVGHGDLLDKEDKEYLKLRWLFRTPLFKLLIKVLPESILFKIGDALSTTEQKEAPTAAQSSEFFDKWKTWTEDLYKERPYDVFICGHFHFRVSTTVSEGDAKAINLGTWLDGNFEPLMLSL